MHAVIADTETTGFKEPQVIEVAALPVAFAARGAFVTHDGPIYWERFQPSKPIELGAAATHHILPPDLVGCRASGSYTVPAAVQYIIGHNVDFDWEALGKPPCKRICTLAMSRYQLPELDAHRLSALVYHFLGMTAETRQRLKGAHSAVDDVMLTLDVLQRLIAKSGATDFESLWQYSEIARVPKTMVFGKHKGMPVEQVPHSYRMWYIKQTDPPPDPYLLKAWGLT